MSSNKKITLIIFTMISILAVIIIILIALGSRHSGYDGAKKRAYLTAELVKNSLTSHMINGTMHQRDTFLNSLNNLQGIKGLWVVRSKSVSEQFGNSLLATEKARDQIDQNVLKTGIEEVVIKESLEDATLIINIPYTASSLDKPNCMSCHNAQEGQVLGAISLTFGLSYRNLHLY